MPLDRPHFEPFVFTSGVQDIVKKGTTKSGRHFIRVRGTKAQALSIAKLEEKQGRAPSEVKQDLKNAGVWYFYLSPEKK